MIRTPPPPRRFALAVFAALAACLPPGCGKEAPPEEHEDHPAPVKWEHAEKADLEEWTELLGITQPLPDRVAHVSAAVGGYVLSVLPADKDQAVMEGQEVKKGRVLVRLDDRVLRATRDKLLAGKTEQEQQVIQAKLVVELARIEVERLERLHGTSNGSLPLVTRIEMDRARLSLDDAKSKLMVAEKKEDVIKAELKVIDEQLDQYTLRAPIAGRLGLVHAAPGKTLSAGATVAEIINLDEIDVLCFVPARTVGQLKLDQPVRMELGEPDEDATKAEMGRIVFVAEQAQVETGTVAVKARFPNRQHKVRGNTLVRVRVLTNRKADCLTVPEDALLEDQEDPAVLVVATKTEKDEHGKEEEKTRVHRYVAELGLRDRVKKRVEVLRLFEVHEEKKKEIPLTKDTLFVVEGGHGLEDNDLVKLKKEEEHEEGEHKEGEHKEGEKKESEKK